MSENGDYRTYSEAGVDISAGEKCSSIAYRACVETYGNRKGRFGEPKEFEGSFSAPISIDVTSPDTYLVKNSDGVGSKALIAQRMDRHVSLGFDLVAMNADDAAAVGAEPFVGTNILDIAEADPAVVGELMTGLVRACDRAHLAMVGGEIAELPDQLKGFNVPYIWNADTLGVVEKGKEIDGSEISAGDPVVALRSAGMRSNGFTLARKILKDRYGRDWVDEEGPGGKSWGEALLEPSAICTPALTEMVGKYGDEGRAEISGIAHVTGGGIENLDRILPEEFGASLDGLFAPHPEMKLLQEMGPVSDPEAYRTWNMGQCMFIVTDQPDRVVGIAEKHGLQGKECGRVDDSGKIEVRSRGVGGSGFKL